MGVNLTVQDLKLDCRHFRGDVPCKPHKEFGVHCIDEQGNDCSRYDPVDKRILIVKLGAVGDVIRTTPLLRKLKNAEPRAEIWWVTLTPEVIPGLVDVVLPFTPQTLATLRAVNFDTVINLDKDREACALTSTLSAKEKKGFGLRDGKCVPINAGAHQKYLTGVFDDISKANTKSYQEEIFEVCGFTFSGERYIMPEFERYDWRLPRKRLVGLNTGCGTRWTSRLWPEKYWTLLAKKLKKDGYFPLLLGGEDEHKKNQRIAKKSGARYLGYFPLSRFMSEMDRCDLVVTTVTMALHIAVGLGKKIVLLNNIFNKNEFELYGLGEILEPDFECSCYYSPVCPNNCMSYLSVERVFDAAKSLLASTA